MIIRTELFWEFHSTSTRAVADDISVSPATKCLVLRDEGIQPFHSLRILCPKDDDYLHYLDYVRWVMHKIMNNP